MENVTKHTLIAGDSRNMALIPDKSVHLIVTSPPYWQLKDYGSEGQIGFHDSYEGYAPVPAREQKEVPSLTKEEWNTCFASHWTFGGTRQDGHIAVFPEEQPVRHENFTRLLNIKNLQL